MQPTALNPIKPLYPNIYWMFASLLIEITILLTHNSESLILSVSSNLFEVFPGNIYRIAHCTIFRKTKTILKSERPTLNRYHLSNLSQKYKIKFFFTDWKICPHFRANRSVWESNQSAVWINDFSRFSKILPEDPMSRAMMDGDALWVCYEYNSVFDCYVRIDATSQ